MQGLLRQITYRVVQAWSQRNHLVLYGSEQPSPRKEMCMHRNLLQTNMAASCQMHAVHALVTGSHMWTQDHHCQHDVSVLSDPIGWPHICAACVNALLLSPQLSCQDCRHLASSNTTLLTWRCVLEAASSAATAASYRLVQRCVVVNIPGLGALV